MDVVDDDAAIELDELVGLLDTEKLVGDTIDTNEEEELLEELLDEDAGLKLDELAGLLETEGLGGDGVDVTKEEVLGELLEELLLLLDELDEVVAELETEPLLELLELLELDELLELLKDDELDELDEDEDDDATNEDDAAVGGAVGGTTGELLTADKLEEE